MDLIDDVHTVLSDLRGDPHLVYQLPDIIYRIVGCRIQFVNGIRASLGKRNTGFTGSAGFHTFSGIEAIDGFGKDPGTGGFANTPGAAEKIGMGKLFPSDGILKGCNYIVLINNIAELLRTVFPGRNYKLIHRTQR
jgi:hypothetical protein